MRKLSNTNARDEEVESTAANLVPEETLADRLQMIIGSESVASFAQRSGVGESLLRKYLNGACRWVVCMF